MFSLLSGVSTWVTTSQPTRQRVSANSFTVGPRGVSENTTLNLNSKYPKKVFVGLVRLYSHTLTQLTASVVSPWDFHWPTLSRFLTLIQSAAPWVEPYCRNMSTVDLKMWMARAWHVSKLENLERPNSKWLDELQTHSNWPQSVQSAKETDHIHSGNGKKEMLVTGSQEVNASGPVRTQPTISSNAELLTSDSPNGF